MHPILPCSRDSLAHIHTTIVHAMATLPLFLDLQVLLEDSIGSKSNGIDADEALRIQGVVFQALASVLNVHGGQVGAVEGAG